MHACAHSGAAGCVCKGCACGPLLVSYRPDAQHAPQTLQAESPWWAEQALQLWQGSALLQVPQFTVHGRKRLNGFANLTCNVRLIILLLVALVGRPVHPIAVPVCLLSLVPDGISFPATATEDGPWPLGRKVVLHAGASRSSCLLMHQLSLKPALATSLDIATLRSPSRRQSLWGIRRWQQICQGGQHAGDAGVEAFCATADARPTVLTACPYLSRAWPAIQLAARQTDTIGGLSSHMVALDAVAGNARCARCLR